MPEHSPETTVTYCRHCEATLPLDANYCHTCGKSISADGAHRDHTDRVIEFYSVFHLTFISIIQAAALGYLLVSIKSVAVNVLTKGVYNPVIIVLIATTFLVIVSLWQGYIMETSIYRYVPQTPDMIIPFFLALAESLMIYGIDFQNIAWWYFSNSLYTLVVFFAFFFLYKQARKQPERNRVVLKLAGSSSSRIKGIGILGCGVLTLFFGVFESTWKMNSLYFAVVPLVMAVIWLVYQDIGWKKLHGI